MKKLTAFGLILALMLASVAIFTGCEPNVPENNNDNDEITIIPNDNNRDSEDRNNEDMFEDPFNNEHEDEFENEYEYDDEEYDNNGTSAVEGDTPTADFENDSTINEAIMTLTALSSRRQRLTTSGASTNNDFSYLSNEKIGWGLGKDVDEYNRPTDAVRANQDFGELGAIFIGEHTPDSPTVYLTFDEGYENGCTAAILDALKWRNAHATFFVTYDYCKNAPDLVQRMIDEGHTVGNHSYTHPSFPECSPAQIRDEILKLHDYVKETFNYEMNLIRFPMGEFSERSLAVAQSLGYSSVFWSFAYIDWNVNNQPDAAQSLEKIKISTHPGGIFLLHAVSRTNADILGDLLDYWRKEGYSLGVIEHRSDKKSQEEQIFDI